MSAVEAFCDDTGYPQTPQTRFDEATLGAAGMLARLGTGDVQQMGGTLLAQAIPPVPRSTSRSRRGRTCRAG